ncbi:MAG: hypothetical protein EZS28_037820 [Streblomastix strix]|uniref:Uncharacterized protein n=1 Tax=Streblomastix strix TaxID=222440 RepID=A0A5J4U8Z5_9EUKA|nr:MAG: hypothetical protein EZS28_037820 [Streblomastix strix]
MTYTYDSTFRVNPLSPRYNNIEDGSNETPTKFSYVVHLSGLCTSFISQYWMDVLQKDQSEMTEEEKKKKQLEIEKMQKGFVPSLQAHSNSKNTWIVYTALTAIQRALRGSF